MVIKTGLCDVFEVEIGREIGTVEDGMSAGRSCMATRIACTDLNSLS